jgi:PAS domain S-box-containing protein
MTSARTDKFLAYFVAVLSVALALTLSCLILPWTKSPTAFFTMAIVFTAWFGGLYPALLSALLAASARYVILRDVGRSPLEDLTNLVVFCVAALLIGMLFNERHRTEDELRRQREWLKVTLASIGDAVITTDRLGCVTFLNSIAERMTGWSLAEAQGIHLDSIFKAIDEQTRVPAANPVLQVLQSGDITRLKSHTSLVSRDGREVPIEDSAAPIIDADGCMLGAVMVFRDVTASRQVEQQGAELLQRTQDARQAAERANRAKDEFLAVVSHELRTPLTAILGWTRLVRAGSLDAASSERALEIIESNARTQSKLIEDLLDVSRIISGKLLLETRRVDFRTVIEGAFEAVRPSAEARGIHLECVSRADCPPVLGDPDRLRQIVYNLLTNAIKFTPRGGRVTLCLERRQDFATLTVTDTGIGMEREFLPYVFERFRQENSTTTRNYKGLGLGLAIVRHLVELHGGTIAVESPGKNRGATFIVQIPGVIDKQPPPSQRNTRVEPHQQRALTGMRVLVVEDEEETCELVSKLLEQQGASVAGATSVGQALSVFDRFKPSLLISDIGMPGEDGYSLVGKIRARSPEAGGHVPAIALTAFTRAEDQLRALSSGFHAHIAKPIDAQKLMSEILRVSRR